MNFHFNKKIPWIQLQENAERLKQFQVLPIFLLYNKWMTAVQWSFSTFTVRSRSHSKYLSKEMIEIRNYVLKENLSPPPKSALSRKTVKKKCLIRKRASEDRNIRCIPDNGNYFASLIWYFLPSEGLKVFRWGACLKRSRIEIVHLILFRFWHRPCAFKCRVPLLLVLLRNCSWCRIHLTFKNRNKFDLRINLEYAMQASLFILHFIQLTILLKKEAW